MATKRIAAPEWLSTRRDENPDRWQGSNALPLIAATLADARSGIIRATTDPSEIGELLRTYALVQARYGIVDLFDEAEGLSPLEREHFSIAHQYWLQELTNRATGSKVADWNDGTGSAIARSISTLDDPLDIFDAALPHLMTGNMNAITRAIEDEDAVNALRKLKRIIARRVEDAPPPSTENLDYWGNRGVRADAHHVARIAHEIGEARRNLKTARARRRVMSGDNGDEIGGNKTPHLDGSLWHEVVHSPNRLTRAHVGKIGAKRSPADTGRTIRRPDRALTDPSRRIFERRARSKNALVILDMSGSMNYTTDDLDRLLELARGAVVVGYSMTSADANFHLLARDGMRVAELPRHGGSNGLDGTALTYAVAKYRKNATTPIVWVSDGEVNGIGGASSGELAADMIARLRATGAHHVETADRAIELLERMAQGHRPAPSIGGTLRAHAMSR